MNKSNERAADGLRNLICDMLREAPLGQMTHSELQSYIYASGVALHNLPENLANETAIRRDQFEAIDQLDPSSTDTKWGEWVSRLAKSFGQVLPIKVAE